MPVATINRVTVNYVVQGTGPHLLMFAPGGFNSTISNWTARHGKNVWKEMDALSTLSRYFTVIAYDRRESGLSGGRVEHLTWDLYAQEAKELLALAQAKQAYMLGSCMGVAVATKMAALHASACKGLLLHWPVGGYRWMTKCNGLFNSHLEFARAHGLTAVVSRALQSGNFWADPESGPWAPTIASDPEFAAHYARQNLEEYLDVVRRSRDSLFSGTMPSGATGDELLNIRIPALIISGADASHSVSSSWALKELLPQCALWDVLPPRQNAQNTLEQILRFKSELESVA